MSNGVNFANEVALKCFEVRVYIMTTLAAVVVLVKSICIIPKLFFAAEYKLIKRFTCEKYFAYLTPPSVRWDEMSGREEEILFGTLYWFGNINNIHMST